jgi:putative redox protein
MKTRITWLEDMTFVAQSPSGHALVLDGPPELGGHNLGPRPMELLLMGMGGCTAIDVVNILRKSRQEVRGCEVQIEAERADSDPKVFTAIQVHFILTGVESKRQACRTRHSSVGGKILFGLDHARPDRPNHPHLGNSRRLRAAAAKVGSHHSRAFDPSVRPDASTRSAVEGHSSVKTGFDRLTSNGF